MSTCGGCGAALNPAWKFCIRCGTSAAESDALAVSLAEPVGRSKVDDRLERRVVLLLVGTLCFLAGVAVFAFALVVVLEYFR